jgi:hypothetical protein
VSNIERRPRLAAHGPSYARLDPVYLGDDLYSRQAVRAAGDNVAPWRSTYKINFQLSN